MREHRTEYVVQRRFLGTREPCENWDDWDLCSTLEGAVSEKQHAETLAGYASEYRIVVREITETVL